MSDALELSADDGPGTALAVVRQSTSTIVALDKDDILGTLKAKLATLPTDISSKKNREAIVSAAHSVSTTKQALLKLADASVEEAKKTVKAVTAEKKTLEERMDALRDQVRAPVTAWEQIEKDRVAGHEAALRAISDLFDLLPPDVPPAQIKESLDRLDEYEAARDWQEFAQRASDLHAATGFRLTQALNAALAREEAAREAERRRLEAEEAARQEQARLQREREARIAAEAAQRAREEAEARAAEAAARERQRVEQERLDAEDRAREAERAAQAEIEALEEAARIAAAQAEEQRLSAERQAREAEERAARAEQQRVEAERRAERDRIAAVEAERARAAAQKAEEDRAAEERARNMEIKRKVNFDAAAALVVHAGITEQQAQRVIVAIAKGQVPSVRVSY